MFIMSRHLFYIFNNERLLVGRSANSYYIYSGDECPDFIQCSMLHLFDEHEGTKCYVGNTTDEELPDGYQWVGLRESYHLLPGHLYQQAGKAAEIHYFDTHHRYCGICGGEMVWHSPISKRCIECNDEIWPQLNTAIIVLVRRGEEALLVKARNFKRNHYGLVAGFVETGESLEECVKREVMEETGIEITNIRYFASQPWPYPMGLMVGFQADYVSGEIQLVDGELRDASFFRRDNLPPVPEKLSMARMLIDNWLEGN
jgi:NAD+ diphosphatase